MRIHFIGIDGVSMRALADLAKSRGHKVSGSDMRGEGHCARNVDGAELVVYTNAVPPDNCELQRARELGIPAIERAEYLANVAKKFGTAVAVAGCHGKSTATAMLGEALRAYSPTVHVGAKGASRIGGGRFFITEACEYKRSFLKLNPDIGVVLNVGYDHPDCYGDREQVEDAFKAFANQCKTLIVNGDDPLCAALSDRAATFGLSKNCAYRAENVSDGGARSFTYAHDGRRIKVNLSVVGMHNVYNALAALAAADKAGVPLFQAVQGISHFTGIPRRFERKGIACGKTVFCDYAHHPDEIKATIAAARELFPSVAIVFQPHTYSRTAALEDEFVDALNGADTVVFAPIFAAREKNICGASSHSLCRKLVERKQKTFCFDTFAEIISFCKTINEKALVFMGAGDIDVACDRFMKTCGVCNF